MYSLIVRDYSIADIEAFSALSIRRGSTIASLAKASSDNLRIVTPNEIASLDKKKYDLIFEPNDPVLYAAKDTFITLNVIPVYSMNVTAGNFGTVILE